MNKKTEVVYSKKRHEEYREQDDRKSVFRKKRQADQETRRVDGTRLEEVCSKKRQEEYREQEDRK